jgi:hypothetical protein
MPERRVITAFFLLAATVLPPFSGNSLADKRNEGLFNRYIFLVKVVTPSGPRALTGFRMKGVKGIITALHGVADATGAIPVNSVAGLPDVDILQLYDVDVEHDLARLSSPKWEMLPDAGFDPPAGALPPAGSKVTVVGYPLNVDQESLALPLEVGTPNVRVLERMVDAEKRTKLQKRDSPRSTLKVLYVVGPVNPGLSGAPVLDSGNRVVAVANGGLRLNSNIGWAVPWQNVRLVRENTEPRFVELRKAGNNSGLFAFESDVKSVEDRISELRKEVDVIRSASRALHEVSISAELAFVKSGFLIDQFSSDIETRLKEATESFRFSDTGGSADELHSGFKESYDLRTRATLSGHAVFSAEHRVGNRVLLRAVGDERVVEWQPVTVEWRADSSLWPSREYIKTWKLFTETKVVLGFYRQGAIPSGWHGGAATLPRPDLAWTFAFDPDSTPKSLRMRYRFGIHSVEEIGTNLPPTDQQSNGKLATVSDLSGVTLVARIEGDPSIWVGDIELSSLSIYFSGGGRLDIPVGTHAVTRYAGSEPLYVYTFPLTPGE